MNLRIHFLEKRIDVHGSSKIALMFLYLVAISGQREIVGQVDTSKTPLNYDPPDTHIIGNTFKSPTAIKKNIKKQVNALESEISVLSKENDSLKSSKNKNDSLKSLRNDTSIAIARKNKLGLENCLKLFEKSGDIGSIRDSLMIIAYPFSGTGGGESIRRIRKYLFNADKNIGILFRTDTITIPSDKDVDPTRPYTVVFKGERSGMLFSYKLNAQIIPADCPQFSLIDLQVRSFSLGRAERKLAYNFCQSFGIEVSTTPIWRHPRFLTGIGSGIVGGILLGAGYYYADRSVKEYEKFNSCDPDPSVVSDCKIFRKNGERYETIRDNCYVFGSIATGIFAVCIIWDLPRLINNKGAYSFERQNTASH